MTPSSPRPPHQTIGRYVLEDEIAAGGMATVHLGRQSGAGGFSRVVAIKRLHAHIARDADFRAMILDEAWIVSRIQHTNVVPTIDVVSAGSELLLVMDYVHGESLHRLARAVLGRGELIPPHVAITIIAQVLYGLHAAHEATDEHGRPLDVVHRDVSPQNILVGADGVARVIDFGVAKAAGRIQATRDGAIKGKLSYMPPEQFRGGRVDRRTDIYSASVVLWQLLVGRDLYRGPNEAVTMARILEGQVPAPSGEVAGLPPALDEIVLKGLSLDPRDRFATAHEMAEALHRIDFATAGEVGAFVRRVAETALEERSSKLRAMELRDVPAPDTDVSMGTPPRDGGDDGRDALRRAAQANAPPTVTALENAPPPQRGRVMALGIVLGAGMVGALVLGFLLGHQDSKANAVVIANPSPPVVSVAPPARSAPVVPVETVNLVVPPPSVEAPTPATAARPSARKPPALNCSPPYVVDPDGVRTPKPECL